MFLNQEALAGENILIVYFSRWGNADYPEDVDASTSASIIADGNERYGTTEYMAGLIRQVVGGDIHRIETVEPYTADFDELRDVNHDEMDRDYLPELKESSLDFYPENLEGGQKNFENGDITYCEAHHNRFLITGFAKRFL